MDISSLRERPMGGALSVSELNNYIKNLFENDRSLRAVTVKGEISNFTRHSTGHLYFSLKDTEGQIRAVMFRSSAVRLAFMPESGMKVIVHGSVSSFPRDGSYQIYVNSMQPDGIGALYLAYEQLKTKLSEEGLFDPLHKKPIPKIPTSVGVITSPTGAAVRDIINVCKRRFPLASVYLYPSLVQGAGAEPELIRAVDFFDKSRLCDVVIIGRGGGSIEDLWAFNSEKLARRIFDAEIPIISAVGHETDFTICDFVADLRAPTPSAAAELAVPDSRALAMQLDGMLERAANSLRDAVLRRKDRLQAIAVSSVLSEPSSLFEKKSLELSSLCDRAKLAVRGGLTARQTEFSVLAGKLDALSPLSVLARGYSVANKNGAVVKSAKNLKTGDELAIRFSDGEVKATVDEVNI